MRVQIPSVQERSFFIEEADASHDLEKAASVINAAYKKVQYLKEGTPRITPDELKEITSDPRKRIYFCLSPEREICGSILLEFSGSHQAELGLFSIHPDFQGKKIGPLFLTSIEKEAFKRVSEIVLKVIPLYQEKLIQFYERMGYQKTGEILEFPKEHKERYIRPDCRDRVYFSLMKKTSASKT